MSAHRCLIAWKLPIGRPNWTRSLAYSTAIANARAAPPEPGGRAAVEVQPAQLAGPVHRRLRPNRVRRVEVNPEQRGAVSGLRDDDGDGRGRRVQDRVGTSVQPPPGPVWLGPHRIPPSAPRHGGEDLPAEDLGDPFVVTGADQRVEGQHGA